MPYDFSVLNDKEFEELSRDILCSQLNIDFQSFKSGRDRGIDLRYSSPDNSNAHVVQVKHFLKSGIDKLLSHLEKSELPKVEALKPGRYYVVTSLPLSPQNKDKIFRIFKGFMESTNDIYGQEDLNKYLSNFKEIERKWFKLWLASSDVLQTTINNDVTGRSLFASEVIKKNIRLYVKTGNLKDAREILHEYKYILITGQPGVGKTTLAKLLAYELMAHGFELVYIDGDVKDGEKVFSRDPEKKQIFYFDDFLGANYLEITNPKSTESGIVHFIERIKYSENKLLILTARTTIYNDAVLKFEKLKRSRVDIARRGIELGEYSEFEKAQILYNHLYHSELPDGFCEQIFKDHNYNTIIAHRNYNPRIIEYITQRVVVKGLSPAGYFTFVLRYLNNPDQVWHYTYEQQLSTEDRLLMHTVFIQSRRASISESRSIFNHLLKLEIDNYNHRPPINPFANALKKLLDGVISLECDSSKTDMLSFVNPSINDFLNHYFAENSEERWKLIRSLTTEDSIGAFVYGVFNAFADKEAKETESSLFTGYILDNMERFPGNFSVENKIRIHEHLSYLDLNKSISEKLDLARLQLFQSAPIEQIMISHYECRKIIDSCIKNGELYKWVTDNWNGIILRLIRLSENEDDLDDILALFKTMDQDYSTFLNDPVHQQAMYNVVKPMIYERIKNHVRDFEPYLDDDWSSELQMALDADQIKDAFDKYGLKGADHSEPVQHEIDWIKVNREKDRRGRIIQISEMRMRKVPPLGETFDSNPREIQANISPSLYSSPFQSQVPSSNSGKSDDIDNLFSQ